MHAYLKPHIHMTPVGDDVVVLDVRHDTYFCLIGASAVLTLDNNGAVAARTDNALQALAQAGLLSDTVDRRKPMPVTPSRATRLELEAPATLWERARFVRTSLSVLRDYHCASFATLINDPGSKAMGRMADPESSALHRQVALFARWLPWVPAQGTCLYRAFFLRRLLWERGLVADWVFGVTTWPFSAHCWLQVEDLLLDDDVDRVRAYRPIMVV